MDKNLVSVIIPVYNTEEFVEEAVRSIMNQTLQEIEIIVINDGSTDGSLSIIERLAKEDKRIRTYTQQNQGLSATRNKGNEYAQGKYIYFMDSDDYLEPETLETCYIKCEQQALDFVLFDADILNKEKHKSLHLNYQRKDCTNPELVYQGPHILKLLMDHKAYSPSACLNFIRREYLTEIQLDFLPGIIHEDQLFTCLLYLQAQRVSSIHKDFFKRRLREDSIMTSKFSMRNMESYFTITAHLSKFADSHPMFREIIDLYLSRMLNAAVWLSYKTPFKDLLKIARRCLKEYRQYVTTKNLIVLLFKSFL